MPNNILNFFTKQAVSSKENTKKPVSKKSTSRSNRIVLDSDESDSENSKKPTSAKLADSQEADASVFFSKVSLSKSANSMKSSRATKPLTDQPRQPTVPETGPSDNKNTKSSFAEVTSTKENRKRTHPTSTSKDSEVKIESNDEEAFSSPKPKRPKVLEKKTATADFSQQQLKEDNNDMDIDDECAIFPPGTPGCLSGMSFFIMGTVNLIKQNDFSAYIMRLGAAETNKVTKQTTHICYGKNADEIELSKARNSGITIMTVAELFDFIRSQSQNRTENYSLNQSTPQKGDDAKRSANAFSPTSCASNSSLASTSPEFINLPVNEVKMDIDSQNSDVIVGAVDCLKGMVFAQTGTLNCMNRTQFSNYMKSLGALETSSFTKKTTHLIYGGKVGEAKQNKAREYGVTILAEDELINFIRCSSTTSDVALVTTHSEVKKELSTPSKIKTHSELIIVDKTSPNTKGEFFAKKDLTPTQKKEYIANESPPLIFSSPKPMLLEDTDDEDLDFGARGAPNCLTGQTFVITGDLRHKSREEATMYVEAHGGRVTTSVSGKTTYLVVGENPGPTKLKKAEAFGTKTLDEMQFYKLVRTLPGTSGERAPVKKTKAQVEKEKKIQEADKKVILDSDLPWTEKYKPIAVEQIIGNDTIIKKLSAWLSAFETAKISGFSNSGPSGNSNFRAALLSGPPGIGKTTTAHVVAKSLGFHIIEFNASDTRSKKSLDKLAPTLFHNTTLFGCEAMNPTHKKQRQVVIMDEIDGMSSDDRGGLAQLTVLIKKSQVPVICICNDRSDRKMRTLEAYCLDLRFRRPTAQQAHERILSICKKEGLEIEHQAIDALYEGTQGDVRQVINLLSSYRLSSNNICYDDAKHHLKGSVKDFTANVWDSARAVLSVEFKRMNFRQKLDQYFADCDLMPLFIQENYLRLRPSNENPQGVMSRLSSAADAISMSNIVESSIRMQQQWSLMPIHSLYSVVLPAISVSNLPQAAFQFPSFFGKNSTAGKNQRIISNLAVHMGRRMAGTPRKTLRLELLTHFTMMASYEISNEKFQSLISRMDNYFISREDLDEMFEVGLGNCSFENAIKPIPSQIKSKFTREYNRGDHPVAVYDIGFKKGKKVSSAEAEKGNSDNDSEDPEEIASRRKKKMKLLDQESDENDDDAVTDDVIKSFRVKEDKKTTTSSRGRGRGGAKATRGSTKR